MDFDINLIRRKLSLTRREFAKKVGVTPMTIINWEQGRSVPKHIFHAKLKKLELYAANKPLPLDPDSPREGETNEHTRIKSGKDIVALRTQLDLSQRDLGEKINVAQGTIMRWEHSDTLPRNQKLIRLERLSRQVVTTTTSENGKITTGKDIKVLRQKLELSQDAFAEKLNVARSTLTRWENSDKLTNQRIILRIERITSTSVAQQSEEPTDFVSGEVRPVGTMLARKIFFLQIIHQWTPAQAAQALGVPETTVQQWNQIAQAPGCSVEILEKVDALLANYVKNLPSSR